MRIKLDEISNIIIKNTMPDDAKTEFLNEIKAAAKELNIDIVDDSVEVSDAGKICDFLTDKFKKEIKKQDNPFLKWIKTICLGGVMGYFGYAYMHDNNRYEIEQEYSFISKCVGEQGRYNYKKLCIDILKRCQKSGKSINECNY